jgi:hypothetical protein
MSDELDAREPSKALSIVLNQLLFTLSRLTRTLAIADPGATASEQGTLAKEESAVGLDDQSVSPTPDSSPSKGPESSAAFWQKLDRETVVRLAEQYHLSITIRPDGSTIGFPSDLRKLRALLGGEGGEGQGKGKGL